MLLALTDLLGGFLHHALLPLARKAYYAGAVDYVYMEKLIQLYEELKWFLRTNGQSWTKPLIVTKEVRVAIIETETITQNKDNGSCCQKVMYYEHEPPASRKKRTTSIEKGIYFPLPFFDAKFRPTAIALPLKHFALRNIESKRAAYAVMKYFIAAEECLKEKNAKPDNVQKFRNNLYTWIEKDVIPKLDDDKFYSAFGGILRVQNTLKVLGAKAGSKTCNTDEIEEDVGAVPGIGCSSRRNKLLLVAMLVVIVAWFLIGTCFICYRMKNNRTPKKSDMDGNHRPESSSSNSSSRWSSMLSKSSYKSDKQLCKCCESTITGLSTSTSSEYDSEKSRKKQKKSSRMSSNKSIRSAPCVCPKTSDGPAIIDTKHSMKVLPSIAEISEQSAAKEQSFRKISFADESGISSSDGGGIKICAPPWAQRPNTVPCPKFSDKGTSYTSSRSSTVKTQGVPDSDDPSLTKQTNVPHSKDDILEFGEPLASSSFKHETTGTSNNMTAVYESSSKSINKKPSDSGTVEAEYKDEEKPTIEEELQIKQEVDKETSYYNYHMGACHSSMSGAYDLYHKPDPTKPYIFGYDFQTTTSSDLSDDD